MGLLDGDLTYGDLLDMVTSHCQPLMPLAKAKVASTMPGPAPGIEISTNDPPTQVEEGPAPMGRAQQAFENIRFDCDVFTKETGFADFWKTVYPTQARLVLAYTVEAFATLGCRLASLTSGQRLPQVHFDPKHNLLWDQLHEILKDASLVNFDGKDWIRSDKPVDETPSAILFQEILRAFPHHASEHKLLNITGSKLAQCLTGVVDPLHLLFRRKEDQQLLEDVYANGPMYKATTKLLASFL